MEMDMKTQIYCATEKHHAKCEWSPKEKSPANDEQDNQQNVLEKHHKSETCSRWNGGLLDGCVTQDFLQEMKL